MIKLDKSKVVKNLGRRYKYVPYLERAIATFEDPWTFTYQEKEHDHHWHPSSHCIEPVTHLYAIATDQVELEPISGSLRKIFQVGHFWHQWLQYITVNNLKMCKPEAVERKAKREWGKGKYHAVAGSGDLAPLEAPNWTGLVDYKTTSSRTFAQPGIPSAFADKYEAQMQIYLELFEQEEALIVLINKDSPHDFREILYRRNQPLIDAIINKFKFVSLCLDADERPTAEDDLEFSLDGLFRGPDES